MRHDKNMMDQLNETPVTYAILLAYVTMAYLTQSFGLQTDREKLMHWGAAVGFFIQDGEGWRLLSHAFNHANVLHLGMNAYALLLFGPVLERHLGVWRFIVLYACSALAGCLLAMMWYSDPFQPLVGGSGALFGMIGAALALQVRGGRTTLDFLGNSGSRQLLGVIAVNLVIGWMIPFISNAAHIGGLIGGFVTIYCFLDTGRRSRIDKTGRAIQCGWVVLLLSLTAYQLRPVLRIDSLLNQTLHETDPERLEALRALTRARILTEFSGKLTKDNFPAYLRGEKPPQTGLIAPAFYESYLSEHDEFAGRLKRWKQEFADRK